VQSPVCCGKILVLKKISVAINLFFTKNLDNPLNILDQIEGGNLSKEENRLS
jgi:hypothetical protein